MLPRLLAEESMRAAERMMVGFGTGTKNQRRRIRDAWKRDARPARRARDRRRRVTPPDPALMASIGIGVVQVKARG